MVIPREFEKLVEQELRGAIILSSNPCVDDDGEIVFTEFVIRLRDGRNMTIEATDDNNMVLRLETNVGWRTFNAVDDYGEESEVEPWYPDQPDRWDRE
jgi:hypothetical protein